MRLLIASQFAAGRFSKVAIVRATADGRRVSLPARLCGQLGAVAAKSAARQFAAEPSARDVFFSFPGGDFRVTRV
jgi:hypothetical protein